MVTDLKVYADVRTLEREFMLRRTTRLAPLREVTQSSQAPSLGTRSEPTLPPWCRMVRAIPPLRWVLRPTPTYPASDRRRDGRWVRVSSTP